MDGTLAYVQAFRELGPGMGFEIAIILVLAGIFILPAALMVLAIEGRRRFGAWRSIRSEQAHRYEGASPAFTAHVLR